MAMGFAMVGVFLPITIYFQSVLGLSAFDAGVSVAPMALTMMLFSGVVAPLAARFGKYILMAGLTLFAIGMAYIAWRVRVDSNRWSFVPGLVLGGLGMAGVWTPVFSLATRDLQPRLAGVASGVLNTVQELGTVIGSAAIGAVLQNQLASGLRAHAVGYSAQLPDQFRARFVEGFSQAANRGLEVGRGQTGGSLQLPAGIPTQIVQQLERLAHAVFTQAFVDAMRPSMALAIVVVLVAAFGVLGVRGRAAQAGRSAAAEAYQEAAPVA
jgi:MFS family permease